MPYSIVLCTLGENTLWAVGESTTTPRGRRRCFREDAHPGSVPVHTYASPVSPAGDTTSATTSPQSPAATATSSARTRHAPQKGSGQIVEGLTSRRLAPG